MAGDRSDPSGKSGARPFRAGHGAGEVVHRARRPGNPRAVPTSLGGLDQMIGYVVRRAQLWMVQDFRRVLKALDITPAQFAVMKVIGANPGLSQVRVAEALGIERARLVQMIDSLEAAGRVERTRSTTDRRSHALRLTATGADLLRRTEGPLEVHQRNVVARIGARDKEELLRILAPFLD